MFVQCPECKQHYDDSTSSSKCSLPEANTFASHTKLRSKPIDDHIANVRATRGTPQDATEPAL